MQTVALAAGKVFDELLLIGAAEVEATTVGARRHLGLADEHDVVAVGDLLPHGLLAIERVARLIHVGELYRRADAQLAAIGFVLSDDHAKQRGLTGAVRADDADNAAAWK